MRTPEVERIWREYKDSIEEALVLFEHRFQKIIDRHTPK